MNTLTDAQKASILSVSHMWHTRNWDDPEKRAEVDAKARERADRDGATEEGFWMDAWYLFQFRSSPKHEAGLAAAVRAIIKLRRDNRVA